uniref:LEM domain containing 1 n=1 Tax=Cynoglossus semilaevis TaxID=244447 RepID=A0A3P8WV26_CYNSE
MPAFEEDPALLSKSRLISHLVFHNVKLPPTKSRKVVYVELYQRHIKQRKEVEFSSEKEEEEEAEDLRDGTNPEASEVPDPSSLTDRDLKAELLKHGVTAGPIVGQCELNTQFYVSPGVNSRVAVIFCFFFSWDLVCNELEGNVICYFTACGTALWVKGATCRRPIKWAAMHPMQRKYPDTPVSPRTWEKQEIDRRLVPIHVQIFFFLAVMCLLLSPFVALLDSLDLGSNDEQGLSLQAEAQDVFRMRVMFFSVYYA